MLQIDEKAPDKKQIDLSNFYQNFIITFDKDSMTYHLDTINLISGKTILEILESGIFIIHNYPNMIMFILIKLVWKTIMKF